jgi:hypothetical protein
MLHVQVRVDLVDDDHTWRGDHHRPVYQVGGQLAVRLVDLLQQVDHQRGDRAVPVAHGTGSPFARPGHGSA